MSGHRVDDARHAGAIAMWDSCGDSAVAVIDTGGSVREGANCWLRPQPYRQADPLRDQHPCASDTACNAAFVSEGTSFVATRPCSRARHARAILSRRLSPDDGRRMIDEVRIVPPTVLVDAR